MANINFAAIRKRIREVLDDGNGLARTVAAGRVSGSYWTGANQWQGKTRAIEKPRFTINAIPYRPADPGAMELGDFQVYVIEPVIECEYKLPSAGDSDLVRDTAVATAEQDADVFRQALGWSGNMLTTEAGAATGIIDGYLRFVSFSPVTEDWTEERLITQHSYIGRVKVTTAV